MNLKAVTLLELIIVFSIIAVLAALGAAGLLNYRSSVQLQNAYTDFISGVKNIQNKANNSISYTKTGGVRVTPIAYSFRFQNSQHYPYYCEQSAGSSISCAEDVSERFISLINSNDVNLTSNCVGVGFIRLSADMVSIDNNAFGGIGAYNTSGICTVTLQHRITNSTRTISLNLTNNNIDL